MRYLIIDTKKIVKGQMSEVRLGQLIADRDEKSDDILLTEEETLALFERVFEKGADSGVEACMKQSQTWPWARFKRTL